MEILGYTISIIIGISLGLIGGGGSILTLPVLVYLFHVPPVTATAYSLFIVGSTSLAGAYPKYKQGLINVRMAILFGIPSIAAVIFTRKVIVPFIPDILFSIGHFAVSKSLLLMLLLAVLMIGASISLITGNSADRGVTAPQRSNYPAIILKGFLTGMLTGLVGAGGGFLIIPAMVVLGRLPIKMAVGTSLAIIAASSLIGFLGDISGNAAGIDWALLLMITALAVAGIFIGNIISIRINGASLRKFFGWFVLLMGIYIVVNELAH